MCTYCTCQEQDNTRLHGMRLKAINGDNMDHQGDSGYTWTDAPVTNASIPAGMEKTPPVGYGSTVGKEVTAAPVRVGTD